MKNFKYLGLVAPLLLLAACGQMGTPETAQDDIQPLSSVVSTGASIGGSETSPVSVVTDGTPSSLSITFAISGKQDGTAKFSVNQNYTFNGTSWVGSNAVEFTVNSRTSSAAEYRTANITLSSSTGSGSSAVQVTPFDITNTNTTGSKLGLGEKGTGIATVYVKFVAPTPPNTAPSITIPDNITEEATSADGATAKYSAGLSASDNEDGDLTDKISCAPASGSTFALGETTVTCSVTDLGGLKASRTFTVTVVDTTAPVITVPSNITAEATSADGAKVSWTAPTANDAVTGTRPVTCDRESGSTFALGTATVTCSAADGNGNSASKTFEITVQDTKAPTLSLPANISTSATGNSQATVTYTASANDVVDGSVTPSCSPASGSSFPVGTTTVSCSATDAASNTANGSFTVTVGYTFTGFFQPIDMNGVFNVAKAGSAIPVKFKLGGDQGLNIFAAGYPKAVTVSCSASAPSDTIEELATATTSGLKYDATADQYNYTWKTGSWANSCRRLDVMLNDGKTYSAFFKFNK